MFRIIFIGDIVGRPARKVVKEVLPKVRKKYGAEMVIANADNLAHGTGMTSKTIEEMREVGVDFFTGGNHSWDNAEGVKVLRKKEGGVIRPANYPAGVAGRGAEVVKVGKVRVLVFNLQGNVFMGQDLACPFREADKIIKRYEKEGFDVGILDFHAEATSEKVLMKHYVDGRVSLVVGTHTHVPTADVRVSEAGTASVTDVGMCGARESILGVKREIIEKKFLTQMAKRHEVEERGPFEFDGVWVEVDEKSGKARKIKQIREIV